MRLERVKRLQDHRFTTINNTVIRDKTLSLRAKGFLLTVMALPPDWDFSIAGISSVIKEGRDAVYHVINELIEKGYCTREKRYENGKISEWVYTFDQQSKLLPENLVLENQEIAESQQTSAPKLLPEKLEQENLEQGFPTQYKTDLDKDLKDKEEKRDPTPPAAEFGLQQNVPSDRRHYHPAIKFLRELTKYNPDKIIWDDIITALGENFSEARLIACFKLWRIRGHKATNFSWILDWYPAGGLEQQQNGKDNKSYREKRADEAVASRNLADQFRNELRTVDSRHLLEANVPDRN